MRLHRFELVVRELASFEQDCIGDSDFADVVEEGRLPDQLDSRRLEPDRCGYEGCNVGDPMCVGIGVIVAILGRDREAGERFVVGLCELVA